MIIPLDKLLAIKENRYIFSRAAMEAVARIGNISNYPEEEDDWKIVPHILKMVLDDEIKYIYSEEGAEAE